MGALARVLRLPCGENEDSDGCNGGRRIQGRGSLSRIEMIMILSLHFTVRLIVQRNQGEISETGSWH